jgi:hypothetical protein
MSTTKHQELQAFGGAPLAVCINDCQLDCGQPYSELASICFQSGCAFAEMRWGRSTAPSLRSYPRGVQKEQPSHRPK